MAKKVLLDPTVYSPETAKLEYGLTERVVGQERAIKRLVNVWQMYESKLAAHNRPLANLLLLGPTGSGKTHIVEALAEILFGVPEAVYKVHCAEFQHSHEISKLMGAPPGYVGYADSNSFVTQEKLEKHWGEGKPKISLVLFDEIEKAHWTLWQALLGVLDKGELKTGNSQTVSFCNSIIFLTSNLGTEDIIKLVEGGIGFKSEKEELDLDQKIYRVATDAARRKFSPEFMNRMDKVIVFRALNEAHLEKILELEWRKLVDRIFDATDDTHKFLLRYTKAAKKFLLAEGTDAKYGARHLKRALDRFVLFPVASLITTKQIKLGDIVVADHKNGDKNLHFYKQENNGTIKSIAEALG